MTFMARPCFLQDGVELGVYIREAMEEAGKPFGELSPEQIGAALREYEVARSHRVAHIVGKSGKIGSMFMLMGYLVRPLTHVTVLTWSAIESTHVPTW